MTTLQDETTLITKTNGTLEFLGDAAMQLVVSKILYDEFPDYQEGQLSVSDVCVRACVR